VTLGTSYAGGVVLLPTMNCVREGTIRVACNSPSQEAGSSVKSTAEAGVSKIPVARHAPKHPSLAPTSSSACSAAPAKPANPFAMEEWPSLPSTRGASAQPQMTVFSKMTARSGSSQDQPSKEPGLSCVPNTSVWNNGKVRAPNQTESEEFAPLGAPRAPKAPAPDQNLPPLPSSEYQPIRHDTPGLGVRDAFLAAIAANDTPTTISELELLGGFLAKAMGLEQQARFMDALGGPYFDTQMDIVRHSDTRNRFHGSLVGYRSRLMRFLKSEEREETNKGKGRADAN
jgi:hypothetical protein